MDIKAKGQWIKITREQTLKDIPEKGFVLHETDTHFHPPRQKNYPISTELMIQSSVIVADAILNSNLDCLKNLKISEIFKWTEDDEKIVHDIREALKDPNKKRLPNQQIKQGSFYGRYVISAAMQEALIKNANIEKIFKKMKLFLCNAFDCSPTWYHGQNVTLRRKTTPKDNSGAKSVIDEEGTSKE